MLEVVADLVGGNVDPGDPLASQGLDSLAAMELRQRLQVHARAWQLFVPNRVESQTLACLNQFLPAAAAHAADQTNKVQARRGRIWDAAPSAAKWLPQAAPPTSNARCRSQRKCSTEAWLDELLPYWCAGVSGLGAVFTH